MTTVQFIVQPSREETTSYCTCCGRPIYEGNGVLTAPNADSDLADYWYQWSEGHGKRFVLAVSLCDQDENPRSGVVVLSANVDALNIAYTVLEPSESPWAGTDMFPILTRAAVLSGAHTSELFSVVDAISVNDKRLSSRILECRHEA
jgi:hypothetical protein